MCGAWPTLLIHLSWRHSEEMSHPLQVISLSVLGIGPEEADASLASLYLPIIDECNDRIWYPHRSYIPTPAWFEHNRTVAKLNKYLEDKVRTRWAEKFEVRCFFADPMPPPDPNKESRR
jgi:hypothetical protein